ncbi:MAG TPA: SDR family NAD(P)-dependent oxidoreductase [Candidatus Paceibacterota bacterium]|jgi:short-subunit dehydrogenase|nr:SDR family NAD(P)-dependent oxidoreductase [Candidatus Paceibacterota bacterium]
MDIKNKVVVVTGASQGIGHAVAELLGKQGAKMVLAARSVGEISALAKKLPDALAVATDMRKPGDVLDLIDKTLAKYGRIDILINNAGQGMYGPVESIDIDKYKDIMELNVFAVVRAMEAAIPAMRKQGGGMIVNVSSRVSKNYFPNLAAYASTKYALNAISLTARAELEKDHIVVSVMHPKMTATNFGKNAAVARPASSNRPAGSTPAPARPGMEVDTAEAVAEKIGELIRTEEPEAEM